MNLSDEAAAVVAARDLNKSERIRRLKRQGLRQADIARALGVSDQFVSNVVGHMKPTAVESPAVDVSIEPLQAKVQVGEAGRVLIPAQMRAALGMNIGDKVLLKVEDGELRVVTAQQALQRAQALVQQFVPPDQSLAEELIAQRRREAEDG